LKYNFPRGTFWSVQDFSENGNLPPRKEHQSRYYPEISYTLYGCVVRMHILDLKPEIFGGVAEQKRLLEFMAKEGVKPIVSFSHIKMRS
jgi:hypothetical protein